MPAEVVARGGGVDRNPCAIQMGTVARQEQSVPTAEDAARGVGASSSTARYQRDDGGASPTTSLQPSARDLIVRVVPPAVAADLFVHQHYLHSAPAGVKLTLGAFAGGRLTGAVAFNAGPINAHRLVEGAVRTDGMCLARLWLADDLPRNSESRVLGLAVRLLRKHTTVKFLVSYADPAAGHVGTIYQAAGWLYTGTSEAQPLMAIGDGPPRHTRSIASALGTHSAAHFRRQGLNVRLVATIPKHRYLIFVDPSWRSRLLVRVLPYPKKGGDPVGDPRRSA